MTSAEWPAEARAASLNGMVCMGYYEYGNTLACVSGCIHRICHRNIMDTGHLVCVMGVRRRYVPAMQAHQRELG